MNIRVVMVLLHLLGLETLSGAPPAAPRGWEASFTAGSLDANSGAPIRGTEIVHLVAHQGRLYAGNGYWMDSRGYDQTPWAQVLVLEAPDAGWNVDLALGPRHLRVTALESLTFTTDGTGQALVSPVHLLLAASDSRQQSHIWTRDDARNSWVQTTLQAGGNYRRSTRAFAVHRDGVTGVDRVFVAAGALGIFSGVYRPDQAGHIQWDKQPEIGPMAIRPMSFAQANGRLYASAGTAVYQRRDGTAPSWEKVYSDQTREHWELGGIRGLTAVTAPGNSGQSLLFSHTDRIIRIDPNHRHQATVECHLRPFLEKAWGMPVPGSIIAAYSDMMPFQDPVSGRTVHLLGVQGRVERGDRNHTFQPNTFFGWYAGGSYLLRESARIYRLKEINGRWQPGRPKLVAPRTFAVSPFPEDAGAVVYSGGFDANFFPALDTAWIYRAPASTMLRNPTARDHR